MANFAVQTMRLTRDFNSIRVVDELTFNVPYGIIFGLLGPKGAGKTTTMRLLAGLLQASSGDAQVLGYDIRNEGHKIRAAYGLVMEDTLSFDESQTAMDNLEVYTSRHVLTKSTRDARIKELLIQMNLWDRRNEQVKDWDKGSRQKFAIVRAVLHRPQLLFLDEPTCGLVSVEATDVRDSLKRLAAYEGLTVFLTTCDPLEAEELCQQYALLDSGKLLKLASVEAPVQQTNIRLEIIGHNFNQGILSALRAYPEMMSVHKTTFDSNECLILELTQPIDAALVVSTIVNAGGEIEKTI